MTATRIFKKVSLKPNEQQQQYEGDVFELISSLARCAIEYTTVAGRVADFSEMLLGMTKDSELNCAKHTTVSLFLITNGKAGLLSVCMEMQPMHVCQSLLQRVSEENSVEIAAVLRLYYCNRSEVNEDVDALLSRHFTRLLSLNNQVHNRIIDDLLYCLPSLRSIEQLDLCIDARSIIHDIMQLSVSPQQQQCYVDTLVCILENTVETEVIQEYLCHSTHSLISLAIKKWASSEGEQPVVGTVLLDYLRTHPSELSAVDACTFSWFGS